jgi:hypothetical protein
MISLTLATAAGVRTGAVLGCTSGCTSGAEVVAICFDLLAIHYYNKRCSRLGKAFRQPVFLPKSTR